MDTWRLRGNHIPSAIRWLVKNITLHIIWWPWLVVVCLHPWTHPSLFIRYSRTSNFVHNWFQMLILKVPFGIEHCHLYYWFTYMLKMVTFHSLRIDGNIYLSIYIYLFAILRILVSSIGSMYGIFACIWAIFGVNVGKYSESGASRSCYTPW